MAKKQLTIEEKLQAALVPVEEQPYKVPENWCWSYLENVCQIIMGQSPKGADTTMDDSYTPLIGGAADLGDNAPIINKYTKSVTKLSQCGDLIICIRATLGRPVIADGEYCLGRGVAGCRSSRIDISFLRFFFINFERYLYDNATGSTFAQVTSKVLGKMPIPLPPFLEQSRIVARIESLFAKLDEAKEKIQEVLDGAELRRTAILHQAFTGKLTEKWRKSHTFKCEKDLQAKALEAEIGQPESWIRCKIGDYLELKAGKFISAAEINAEISDVTPYECFGGNGVRGYVKNYNTEGTHPLIGRQGALCGNVQVGEGKFYATEHAVVVTYKYDTDTMWIVELLRHMNLNQYSRSVAQPGLAVKNIVELPMVIAPYEEQIEIGRILDTLLSREQSTVTACEEALTTIDTLKKSILARAFRGGLGTNDPAEPNAKELLKEILSA